MQDYQFARVSAESPATLRKLLRQHFLLDEALKQNRYELDFGFAHIRLPKEDQRLQQLLTALRARGEKPLTRVDREYTKQELDAASFLELFVATAGFIGGVDYGQTYDFSNACSRCGAGARAIPPLIVEFRMGKKDLDHLIYEGHLIASERLATGLQGLTGFEATAVRSRRTNPESRFRWLRITHQLLPRSHGAPGRIVENTCPVCSRTGQYKDWNNPHESEYDSLAGARDFNLSWEYHRDWQQVRSETHTRPIGGSQTVVVSQRVRQRMLELKVGRLQWIPVVDRSEAGIQNSARSSQPAATIKRS